MTSPPLSSIVRFGRFTLDPATRQLTRDGMPVHLTPKAFALLSLLTAEAPRVVPKDELHRHLWPQHFVTDASLLGLVKELRRALDDRGDGDLVRTVHRVGYAFAAAVQRESPPAPRAVAWVMAGSVYVPLHQGENLIGRDADCTVRLDLPNVSRRHARIVVIGDDATIEDLGSTNGTLLADRTVARPTPLRDGDCIRVGNATLTFHLASKVAPKDTMPMASPEA